MALLDLSKARDFGVDIISVFRNEETSVSVFEQKFNVRLPEYIESLLTQQQ